MVIADTTPELIVAVAWAVTAAWRVLVERVTVGAKLQTTAAPAGKVGAEVTAVPVIIPVVTSSLAKQVAPVLVVPPESTKVS
jgi:hypothetical protein